MGTIFFNIIISFEFTTPNLPPHKQTKKPRYLAGLFY